MGSGGRRAAPCGGVILARPRQPPSEEFPLLYKVTLGRDVYLGTPEEVVDWMAKAEGAPAGGRAAYMKGVGARIAERLDDAPPIDASSPEAFLDSLADAGLIRKEERPEASSERVDPVEALGDGPVAFGEDLDVADLEADVFESLADAHDEDIGDADEP